MALIRFFNYLVRLMVDAVVAALFSCFSIFVGPSVLDYCWKYWSSFSLFWHHTFEHKFCFDFALTLGYIWVSFVYVRLVPCAFCKCWFVLKVLTPLTASELRQPHGGFWAY